MSDDVIDGEYCKKPVFVRAVEWSADGDHPEVSPFTSHFPDEDDNQDCEVCGASLARHGVIEQGEVVLTVCPGDVIVQEAYSKKVGAVLPRMLFLMAYMKKPLPKRETPFGKAKK